MASVDIKTDIQVPDEIKINLIREDYLDTSNIFRIVFEICLAIAGTILGSIISILNSKGSVPFMDWFFLIVMIIGCISFLTLSIKHYNNSKCKPK
ncbi:hypothetical protein ACE01N_14715 [Saccharicrinis sp. FJH2]|uniref:hypothetical protein n=1 Tax=Saccharicrinis sp. FJH65 TaxID=3344659 RepID=UPI0035F28AEC